MDELQYDVSVVVNQLASELTESRIENAQLRAVIAKLQEDGGKTADE